MADRYSHRVRFTRHARNRLRWIQRRHAHVTEERIHEALTGGWTGGYDRRGNRRVHVPLGSVRLTVVIDEANETVITVWVE